MHGWHFLIASLLIHWFLYKGADRLPTLDQSKNEIIEVSIQDSSDRKAPQVVQQAVPKLNDLKPKNPKYLSEHEQRVEKEMQARESGLTRNAMPQMSQGRDSHIAEKGEGFGRKKFNSKKLFSDISTNSNHLENVAEGPMTILSSDRFTYYSFYARVNEKVYPMWVSLVREAIQRLSLEDSRHLYRDQFMTKLDVVVGVDGNVEEAIVLQSSGVASFDQAAQQAFMRSRQFPNPPKGMIKEDGKIHLLYGVYIEANQIAFAQ